jgi:hypothetical protein
MLLGSKFQEVERMEWMKALTPFINSIMDNSSFALPLITNLLLFFLILYISN